MSDTHAVTTREFVVVEREVDCDDSCRDEGEMRSTVLDWTGLPPRLLKLIANRDRQSAASAVRARVGIR